MAKTESVEVQVRELLEQYNENFDRMVKKVAESTAKETARDLKETSASMFGTGSYSRGWAVTKEDGGYTVHNKTDYQLTHLLENGHVIRNKYGTYGRAPAYRHIGPAEQRGIIRFEELIEEEGNKL